MAETIGITASILQIAQGVVVGVNLAKDIDRAPEELRSLQEQVEIFRSVLRGVNELAQNPTEGIVATTLSGGKKIIEQLHQLVAVKLVRHGEGSDRARRRAWVRDKSKILTLCNSLKDVRETLVVALTANSM